MKAAAQPQEQQDSWLCSGSHGLYRHTTVNNSARSPEISNSLKVCFPCFCFVTCNVSLIREGQEVLLNDGRPNGELLLSTGSLQDANTSDCIYFPATLIGADRCTQGAQPGQQHSTQSLFRAPLVPHSSRIYCQPMCLSRIY